jgi:expansin (peptidoglycan-binding protein)
MRVRVRVAVSMTFAFALAAAACADVIGVQDYTFVGPDGGNSAVVGSGGGNSGGSVGASSSGNGSSSGGSTGSSGTVVAGSGSGTGNTTGTGVGSSGVVSGSASGDTGSTAGGSTGVAGSTAGAGTGSTSGAATGATSGSASAGAGTTGTAGSMTGSTTGSTAGSTTGSKSGSTTGSATGSAGATGSSSGAAGTSSGSGTDQTCGSNAEPQTFNAGLTYYQQTAANNCAVPWPSNGLYVALSTNLYDNSFGSSACGKCVEVTGSSGKATTLVVVDQCPASSNQQQCSTSHLDLSPTAFSAIQGSLNPGEVNNSPGLSVKFVPCPVTGNIIYSVTSTSSQYYLAMVIENAKYGIREVKYRASGSGSFASMPTPSDANPHWVIMSNPPNPIDFQVVDEWGQTLEDDNVRWSAGQNVTGAAQFAACP